MKTKRFFVHCLGRMVRIKPRSQAGKMRHIKRMGAGAKVAGFSKSALSSNCLLHSNFITHLAAAHSPELTNRSRLPAAQQIIDHHLIDDGLDGGPIIGEQHV